VNRIVSVAEFIELRILALTNDSMLSAHAAFSA